MPTPEPAAWAQTPSLASVPWDIPQARRMGDFYDYYNTSLCPLSRPLNHSKDKTNTRVLDLKRSGPSAPTWVRTQPPDSITQRSSQTASRDLSAQGAKAGTHCTAKLFLRPLGHPAPGAEPSAGDRNSSGFSASSATAHVSRVAVILQLY